MQPKRQESDLRNYHPMKSSEIKKIILKAKNASSSLIGVTAPQRKEVLLALAAEIEKNSEAILSENKKDIEQARKDGRQESFIERLSLDREKIHGMSESVVVIAKGEDLLFKTISKSKKPSGIEIEKTIFPLGLIAMIYESRPNVTIDAFSMCFKSGNAVILKGGSEIANSNSILVEIIRRVLSNAGISNEVIQDLSRIDNRSALELMKNKLIDCLIPRGGKGLIDFVSKNAKVPVIITGASVVHTYIDKSADIQMAVDVILNAKGRRVSVCNALDTVLIHKDILNRFLSASAKRLSQKDIELRADKASRQILKQLGYAKLKKALISDFDTEFLDYILAIKTVNDFEEAISHIKQHSLGHSEAIITKSKKQADYFFSNIDAACLYHNTSTQFSDGGEYGMGGEIGISTQKLHARGPFGYKELTTYKYLVRSSGAIRK